MYLDAEGLVLSETVLTPVKWSLTGVETQPKGRIGSGAARRANNADYLLTCFAFVSIDCPYKVEIRLAGTISQASPLVYYLHRITVVQRRHPVDLRDHMCTRCL